MTSTPKRRPRPNAVSAEELASLSHEFRTPLNGVLGMARLLEGTRLTAEQRAYVGALRESGEHLLSLVNDVLDFARLGAGKVELRPAAMDVEALLRSVCELLSPRAQEKGLEIAWAAPAGIGQILADEGRLRQILLNFAGNAVKFTETGGALLSVEARPGGRLRFLVEDTGPGVAPKARARIFEAFAQADPAHGAQLGGAGLGLAIARSLAAAMDGEVGVGAADGGGAAFWFEAAFERIAASEPEPPLAGRTVGLASPNPIVREAARRQLEACGARAIVAEAAEDLLASTGPDDVLLLDHALSDGARTLRRPSGRTALVLLDLAQRDRIDRYRQAGFAGYLIKPLRRTSLAERVLAAGGGGPAGKGHDDDERDAPAIAPGARVLLVEDNPVNALLARALLTREGCAVTHVPSGQAALEAAELAPFDLVLMDMRMPGLSGVDAARALRKAGVSTPIVALTANAFEDDRHACLAAGMDDFLVKPLSPPALRAALARWTRPGWTGRPERARAG
ncbi:response regulator [Phenylobacterium terrae]|uniref:histidine kinase n=1 Tax=Phenylobacterium terrae TaxID=2665495 RepID=A0ABW4MZK6_9CAUL